MTLKIHIQEEREVIMYYHFSTTTSHPFSKGAILSQLATIGLESSSEEIELDFYKSYCFDGIKEIPLYSESSISEDEYNVLQYNVVDSHHTAVLLVDDLEYFLTLIYDSKAQNPEEEYGGHFCIHDNMCIHWISDKNHVILATIQKIKND